MSFDAGPRRMAILEIVFVTNAPLHMSKKEAQELIETRYATTWVGGRYFAKVVRAPHVRTLPGCPRCTSSTCPEAKENP
jgi:hypothetical protein